METERPTTNIVNIVVPKLCWMKLPIFDPKEEPTKCNNLLAQAEIITDDRRLFDRLTEQLKQIGEK